MIHSSNFKAVLDANVIYPVVIRDLLLWFAAGDLYTPLWGTTIFKEWEKVMRQKGATESQIRNRINIVNKAFPYALVKNYSFLIDTLSLPDPDDRHVLATAIKASADVIVTNNLKDFPEEYLRSFDIEVKSADEFATDIIDLNQKIALEYFMKMVSHKNKPALDESETLETLRNNGMINAANYLHTLL